MKCVKISLKSAEDVKKKLLTLGVLDKSYRLRKEGNFIYFPVTKQIRGFNIIEKKLEKVSQKLSFEDLLRKNLTKNEFSLLTKAYDLVGDVAILDIDEKLLKKKKIIAKALIEANKNIKTVARRIGGHEGKYRVRDYEILIGNFLETLHKENGVAVKLDLGKMYFSPRLSNERLRIAKLVKPNETVLVMFSGVGIYPLVITKNSKAKTIYGVEINPNACKYAEGNLRLNKIKNVKLFCGDVRNIVSKLKEKFDRIVMPLPKGSLDFLDLALKYLKKNGSVHLYCFSEEKKIEEVLDIIKKKAKIKVLSIVKAGQPSPRVYRYCVDFQVLLNKSVLVEKNAEEIGHKIKKEIRKRLLNE